MTDSVIFALTLLAALGCGLMAGLFFTFSTFIMKALARLPPAQGIAAMTSINVAILNPWFGAAFFGTTGACVVLAVSSLSRWLEPGAIYRLVGGLLYLVGAVGVTMVCNVPRNDALAAVQPDSADGASLWRRYLREWTAWNHLRTATVLAAAASLTIGLCA